MNRQLHTIPLLTIEINGVPLEIAERRTLWELRVQEKLSFPSLCEITFLEPTEYLSQTGMLALGAKLRVQAGDFSQPLFTGEITAIEHFYESSRGRGVRVRGYDLLHRLRKRQPVRAHVQATLVNLMRELIADLNLNVEANVDSPLWQRIIQFRQTDFELLAEIANRCGLYFTLREDTLHVLTLEGIGDSIHLKPGETLFEASITVNAENSCQSVLTKGWDTLRTETFEGLANVPRNNREIGIEIESNVFAVAGELAIIDENLTDSLQAEALAQSELDWRKSQETIFSGVAEGNPQLHPGAIIEVQDIALALVGKYVLADVNHIFDSTKGYVSEISTKLPKPSSSHSKPSSVATLGVITQVDDPENFGRVRAKLPNYNEVETDWMEVLSVGAGLGKGLLALPDVDDTVLVLFPNNDPAQGIVLGGLYGMLTRENWDWGVEDGAIKRYTLQTATGQFLRFNDATETIRLENSDGSFLEMSAEKVRLHAKRDLEIEAPGQAITIKANTIDFEQVKEVQSEPKETT